MKKYDLVDVPMFTQIESEGMTLRDYFAGQALVGILADSKIKGGVKSDYDCIATASYLYADAMLKARED